MVTQTREGTYRSLIQGVSQQVPQERSDGQLGEQINMLSDPVTGLRRRSGLEYVNSLLYLSAGSFIRVIEILGENYIMVIDPTVGTLNIYTSTGGLRHSETRPYLTGVTKAGIRTTVSRGSCYIVNTAKIPKKQVLPDTLTMNPQRCGYFSVRAGAFSRQYSVKLEWGTNSVSSVYMSHPSDATAASPKSIAWGMYNDLIGNPLITDAFIVEVDGLTVAFKAKDPTTVLKLTTDDSATYMMASNKQRVAQRTELLGKLPVLLDGLIMGVGTERNSQYYQFNYSELLWVEVGKWEQDYKIIDVPVYWTIDDNDAVVVSDLDINPRSAGDDENNPLPKFIDYGITGIGTYQSRLILLSGSYVCMSKTTDFSEYNRTTVSELLDDDPIEISSASLSGAQFEYCIPYNKDLTLVAQSQQAVIPANNTVLTPKTAVIYPSTKVSLSLAAEPQIVARSLYYAYQRGAAFYQVGELIPNSYTDGQYFGQNLTDHVSLYATGVCTCIASSSTNNMAVFTADSKEVLVNQFLWDNNERALMAFHKWIYPHVVVHAQFIQDVCYVFMAVDGNILVGIQDIQSNQLYEKPKAYLDMYSLVNVVENTTVINPYYLGKDFQVVLYNDKNMRHYPIEYTRDTTTLTIGRETAVLAVGLPYTSSFTLTPPFIKDQNDKVIAGLRSTLARLDMQFANTGSFQVSVKDTMGDAYNDDHISPLTWSETQLGYNWVGKLGTVTVPCKTRLSSTECTVYTTGTTDLNLTTCNYIIRLNQRHRRI